VHLDRRLGPSRDRSLEFLVLLLLLLAAVAAATVLRPSDTGDFWYFADRAADLFGSSGLHVYADHPKIQSGPITLLVAGAIESIDPGGFVLVPICSAALCFATIASLASLRGARERSPWMLLGGGLLLVVWWWYLAMYGHLDDAVVLFLAAITLVAIQRGRHVPAAVAVGLMLAVKPWAVFLLPLTPRPTERGWRRVAMPAVSVAVGAVCWAPFLVASSGTLDGMRPPVLVAADSVVQLFGANVGGDVPAVLRMAQLTIALSVVAVVVWRGHPEAALLGGVAVRLALDPATWEYYTVGLVLGALVWDLERSRLRWPAATVAVTLLVPPEVLYELPGLRSSLRLMGCVLALGIVTWTVGFSRRPIEPMISRALRPTSRVRRPGGPRSGRGGVGDGVRPVAHG
jgi:hypothetical protein